MSPATALNDGNLEEAIALATQNVKSQPAEVFHRQQLAELLCLRGEFERADKHLDAASLQDPKAALTAGLVRQLIRGETARRECWNEGRPPELLDDPSEQVGKQLELLLTIRENNTERATDLAAELEAGRQTLTGTCGEDSFNEFRDADDLWQSTLEVLTSTGKYFWIPWQRVELLEVVPPSSPKDLLWPQARLIVNDGPEGQVHLCALYPKTWESEEAELQLGRATEWDTSISGLTQGIGLRMFLVGDEVKTVFDLVDLQIQQS